ncbi:uncharacterized protein LOC128325709 [Hemicordylus capensis]|uniref:uncharacterized protein LOC128325709 n=1 Tax=Hemicordylus capensis TaxID=884348 RepID=UPI0023022D4E|nr:uncharacterized protein LOC128325709 [Hemicordylus capensis]
MGPIAAFSSVPFWHLRHNRALALWFAAGPGEPWGGAFCKFFYSFLCSPDLWKGFLAALGGLVVRGCCWAFKLASGVFSLNFGIPWGWLGFFPFVHTSPTFIGLLCRARIGGWLLLLILVEGLWVFSRCPGKLRRKMVGSLLGSPKAPPPSSLDEDDEEMALIRGLIGRMEALEKSRSAPSDKGAGPSGGGVPPPKVPHRTRWAAWNQLLKSLSSRLEALEKWWPQPARLLPQVRKIHPRLMTWFLEGLLLWLHCRCLRTRLLCCLLCRFHCLLRRLNLRLWTFEYWWPRSNVNPKREASNLVSHTHLSLICITNSTSSMKFFNFIQRSGKSNHQAVHYRN